LWCILILPFSADAVDVKEDEFWDYDKQVDMESFDALRVYNILSRQARDVTRDLGKQKEEVRFVLELQYFL